MRATLLPFPDPSSHFVLFCWCLQPVVANPRHERHSRVTIGRFTLTGLCTYERCLPLSLFRNSGNTVLAGLHLAFLSCIQLLYYKKYIKLL